MPKRFSTPLAISCVLPFSFLLLAPANPASAADYPTKPVNLIVPMAAGGGPDTTFRMLSSEAEKELRVKRSSSSTGRGREGRRALPKPSSASPTGIPSGWAP